VGAAAGVAVLESVLVFVLGVVVFLGADPRLSFL
jgi:hypothetical protein